MLELGGLSTINIELTSKCNKNCWMCGRRKVERDYPELVLEYGDMEFSLVEKIAKQLPKGVVVQFHDNGEPLLYPKLGEALHLFPNQIKTLDTNGILLLERFDDIVDNLDTLTLSTFEDDTQADTQYAILVDFLRKKGSRKPNVVVRCLGDVDTSSYETLCTVATRLLHSPLGSFNYKKHNPTVPEIGVCLDFLHHMDIKRDGKVSMCVRFDPKGLGVIGDCNKQSLAEIWNGEPRMTWLKYHLEGARYKIPLCSYCQFWGVPTG